MRIALLALVACLSLPAHSAQVATFEAKGIRIVLMDDKCRIPELGQAMQAQTGREAMAADVSFEGRILQACWVPANDAVLIIDQEGEGGVIPVGAFQKVRGV